MSLDSKVTSLPLNIQQVQESIVAVDARTFERGCLARVLRSEFFEYEIFEAASAQALSTAAFGRARLVILRIHPDQQSDEAVVRSVDAIRSFCPGAAVALVCEDDEPSLHYALRLECGGYLPSSMPLEIAVAALRLVLVGGLYFPHAARIQERTEARACPPRASFVDAPRVSEKLDMNEGQAPSSAIFAKCSNGRLAETLVPPSPSPDAMAPLGCLNAGAVPGFTPRELEVIGALQRGRSNKVIASDLNLSENTVKVHVRHVMRKLRATNRTQAALRSQLLFSTGTAVN
jgi:DNA-binding NarL/FixJ family response regulator